MFLSRDFIGSLFGAPNLTKYLYLLPVGVLLSGVYNVFLFGLFALKDSVPLLGRNCVKRSLLAIQLAAFKLGVNCAWAISW